MQLLPAGVPRGLLRVKALGARLLGETPILFIGTVLVIAVTFRVAVGAMKTVSAEPEAPPPALHSPVEPAGGKSEPARPAVATPVRAEPTATAPAAPKPEPPKQKPRTHGKR